MSLHRLALTAAVAAASLMARPAQAVPITYTAETVGSGILDGHAFTDADVAVIAKGDTVNVTHTAAFYTNLAVTGTAVIST